MDTHDEWLEWLKTVKMGQLRESLGVRQALMHYSGVDHSQLRDEMQDIEEEIRRRSGK